MWTPDKLKAYLAGRPAVLVYFKNDHCAPCLALRPRVEKLLQERFPKMEMLVVDTRQNPELAGAFQVFAHPALLVFFEGKEYLRKSQYVSLSELEAAIERLYGLLFG